MHRELGDERSRYGRRTWREQLDDAIAWPGSHRFATGILLLVVVGALLLSAARGRPTSRADLRVGDCLYIPTAAALDPTSARPIGDFVAVEDVVIVSGAQEASCTASHGHEVAAIVTGPDASSAASAAPGPLDRDAIRRLTRPLCEAAFPGFVGHALAGSVYEINPVVPEADAWIAGGRRTVCLVARVDGQWMDQPARGSGE
ncbi:MAG: septum formation family protein [Chloroflexi bacterium]|nr:septum formation family protein [Chloroflexota bacterium]